MNYCSGIDEELEIEVLTRRYSTRVLAQALLVKVGACPEQGRREQMKTIMGQLFRMGGGWLYSGSTSPDRL